MTTINRDSNCKRCKLHQTAEYVCLLGQGDVPSKAMIVGEAPGQREDDSGKPFVGPAGQLLIQVLKNNGYSRSDFFITNAVSCRPPGNRTPKKSEIKACKFWYDEQFNVVRPKVVLLLGATALQQALDGRKLKSSRGKPVERDGVIYVPTFHPAYVLRDPNSRGAFEADIRLFLEIMKLGKIPIQEGINSIIVDSFEKLDAMMDDLYGEVSFDIETTTLYPWAKEAKINIIGFGTAKAQYGMPAEHEDSPWAKSTIQKILEELYLRIRKGKLKLICQNGKFDVLYVWVRFDVRLSVYFDTMLAHYLIDENQLHGLDYLAKIHFGALDYDIEMEEKLGKRGLTKKLYDYHALDLYYTYHLKRKLLRQLEEDFGITDVFWHIMMPCVNLFVEIEYHGVFINMENFDEAETALIEMKSTAEKELNKHLPKNYGEINWGSPKQLAKLLFEDLGIEIVEKTAKGAPSTSESVLKRIDHPMVGALLRFREAKQQLSFFIDGWKPFLDGRRLHPSFKLHGTVTGRLSCENPNLQQVPRDPRIRSLIGAPKGWTLIEADLSQIELRIAAELSNDRGLTWAFNNGVDVHWYTCISELKRGGGMPELILKTASILENGKRFNYGDACEVLLKQGPSACEKVDISWKELRKKAKAVNFGYLYGMWWKKFKIYARDNYGVIVTDEQAQSSRKSYFESYPDLPAWHMRQKKFVRKNGYVRSLSGRKRRLPAAMSIHDTPESKAAERQAINSPVQSFASEINLMAALQLRQEFSDRVLYIVGTVHDALLIEVKDEYLEKVHNRVLEIMARPSLFDTLDIDVSIPVEAEAKVGPWGKSKKLKEWMEESHD